jgi:hypothetical protein
MRRACWVSLLVWFSLSIPSICCECINRARPCEYLRSEVAFVGRVVETVAVRHPFDENSYSSGYSMRLAVDESLRGDLGTEITIETGGGGGDCGTPLSPGGRYLIFAYRNEKDGKLWTGMCSGNRQLTGDPHDESLLEQYRSLAKKGTGSIFGVVTYAKPVWRNDDVESSAPKVMQNVIVHADSEKSGYITKTVKDGSYEFDDLPNGKYKITPEISRTMDFNHEYEDNYQAEIAAGACANVNFFLEPITRIQGHVTMPAGLEKLKTIEVAAIPTDLKNLNQFSGKSDFTDETGHFDLWPLPPGDYYVGVNINSSPKEDAPFPPTYYPGVANPKAASIVRLEEGEVKNLELPLPKVAKPRKVHFVAIGLDGKPMNKIYIQLEDLRHPGDAASYVNVNLDSNGAGTMVIYSGYSYHLHGSHWVSYGNDWCSKPVAIPAGTEPVEARFVMYRKDVSCEIAETDGLRK